MGKNISESAEAVLRKQGESAKILLVNRRLSEHLKQKHLRMKSKSASHSEEGPWGLHGDLIITNAILWVAGASHMGKPKPEVHLYLYDRYWRLAEYYERRGNRKKASRFRAKAEAHYKDSGHTDPPFAAAVAMPRPRSPFITWAVGKRDHKDPDDAA